MTAANLATDFTTLREHFVRMLAPTRHEEDREITEIEGEIPRELFGTLYRNGPSQRQLPPEGAGALHLFDGDALVHAFRFEDGRAFHRSRFVRNESFLAEEAAGRFAMNSGNVAAEAPLADIGRVQPNTNVVHHAGRLFALVENAPPFEIDPKSLDPIGTFDFDGRMVGLSTTAHPKIDGRTGQMLIHGYQPVEPFLSLYVVEPDGRTSLAEAMDAPWPGMVHDFAIAKDHVIIPLGPIVFDVQVLAEGGVFADALSWQPELGLKFAVRSREAGSPVRWFDAPTPGFMFHPGNAYEEDGVLYMDACTYLDGNRFLSDLRTIRSGELTGGLLAVPFLYEFDLRTGECRERQLTDHPAEFPRIDDRLVGHKNRFGYAVTSRPGSGPVIDRTFTAVTKYDRTGAPSVHHELAPRQWSGEPVFAPCDAAAGEDEGWVISMVYDGDSDRSCLQILDARALDAEPVARLWLAHRVPLGFHGNFALGLV